MKFRLRCLIFCAALFATACASSGSPNAGSSLPPRSAQYALDIDWTYALSPKETFYLGAAPIEQGHVAVTRQVTYVGSSALSKISALDNAKATKIWEAEMTAPVTAGPIVVGSYLYVALGDGAIIKLNAENAEQVWRFDTQVPIENSLVVSEGVVAALNGNNRLVVLNDADGSVKWRRERPRSSEFTMYGQAAPLIQNDTLYASFSDGYLIAYALSNGTPLWTRDLAPKARFKDLDVQPVIVDDVLYAASSSGGLYALSLLDGRTLWQKDILGASSVIPHQDSLYVSSQAGIFRLDRETGNTLWQNEIQKEALISPLQVGKHGIYATVQRFGLVVLDRASGHTEHVIDMGTDFTSAPVLSHGVLTALSNRSTLYRFIVEDSPL